MSATERAVNVVKSVLLFRETLDRVQAQLGELRTDLASLARDHAVLSNRVSDIEGYLRAATRTPFGETPKLKDEH